MAIEKLSFPERLAIPESPITESIADSLLHDRADQIETLAAGVYFLTPRHDSMHNTPITELTVLDNGEGILRIDSLADRNSTGLDYPENSITMQKSMKPISAEPRNRRRLVMGLLIGPGSPLCLLDIIRWVPEK